MTFDASAPAPLAPIPAPRPRPTAADAAAAMTLIEAASLADTTMSPEVVVTVVSAFAMYAATSLSIWFRASATPIEIDTPAAAPRAAAMLAAPAKAAIDDVSLARRATLPTVMPVVAVPSPSMNALTY